MRVFLCHASEDHVVAEKICAMLETRGTTCWIAPRDVEPGANYAASIVSAIADADVVVLIYSHYADASPHVRRELEQAVNADKRIVPVRIEDSLPTAEVRYYLGAWQWVDAFAPPIERHFERIAAAAAASSPVATPTRRRRRWLVGGLVVALVVVGALAAVLAAQGGGGSAGPSGSTTTGVTAERSSRGILLFQNAIGALTPWTNALANAMGSHDFRVHGIEAEAVYLGAWWALADWCDAHGDARTGVCYDLASDFLVNYFKRDPRTLNSKAWGKPGALGGAFDAGFVLTNQSLGVAGSIAADSTGRPGADVLCEPSCSAVIDR